MVDDDPGRVIARANISMQIDKLELKKKLIENAKKMDIISDKIENYPSASWMRLGSLNSKRIEPERISETFKLFEIAASLPINDAYPIFSYLIENAIIKCARTDQANIYFRPMYKAASIAAMLSLKLAQRSQKQRESSSTCSISQCGTDTLIIRAGEREKAEQFIQTWFEKNVKKYLKICDPYFGPEELNLIRLFTSINPDVQLFILTSKKHQNQEGIKGSVEEHYRKKWKRDISESDPVGTDIVVVGTKTSGDLPIHDRWWISDKGGLRFGISYNGLGISKDSEISILSIDELKNIEIEIDKYLSNDKREHQGERLLYNRFNL